MHPILFEFGKLRIYTYGFMIALGTLAAVYIARKEAVRVKESPEYITDFCFYILIAAIVGSRLFYIALDLPHYLHNPLEIFKIWQGGLVFYGGFIMVMIMAPLYVRYRKLPFLKTADILAPAIPLGHAFGRVGCFFAGCCYGKACDLPWAVTFTNPESLAPLNTPIHPTQLYSALNNLAIFLVLWFLRKRKKVHGQLFFTYIVLYGLTRSLIESIRGDYRGEPFFGLFSVSQVIGVSVALIGLIVLVVLFRRGEKMEENVEARPKKKARKKHA